MFDLAKKDALVLYIDSLLHYFPNQSPEMEGFLKALIQWLRQWQYQVLTPEMFKAKANVSNTIKWGQKIMYTLTTVGSIAKVLIHYFQTTL